MEVITATVHPSASIEQRAEELARDIEAGAKGKDVNIIAYERMSSLDKGEIIANFVIRWFRHSMVRYEAFG